MREAFWGGDWIGIVVERMNGLGIFCCWNGWTVAGVLGGGLAGQGCPSGGTSTERRYGRQIWGTS